MEHVVRKDWGWWAHFFLTRFRRMDPSVKIYDRTLADFCFQILELTSGSTIIDAGCGAGQVAAVLSQRGLDVTGIDFSSELIDFCRTCNDQGYRECRFLEADLRQPLPDTCMADGVICLGVTFGYFSHELNVQILENLSRVLNPGGKLIIESDDPLSLQEGWVSERCTAGEVLGSPAQLVMKRRFVPFQSSYEGHFHLQLEDGRKVILSQRHNESCDELIRVYSVSELASMGKAVDLSLEAVYGDSSLPLKEYISGASQRLVTVFRKKELLEGHRS